MVRQHRMWPVSLHPPIKSTRLDRRQVPLFKSSQTQSTSFGNACWTNSPHSWYRISLYWGFRSSYLAFPNNWSCNHALHPNEPSKLSNLTITDLTLLLRCDVWPYCFSRSLELVTLSKHDRCNSWWSKQCDNLIRLQIFKQGHELKLLRCSQVKFYRIF